MKCVGATPVLFTDIEQLRTGNVKSTTGDIRCVAFGHLIRLAIWSLSNGWDRNEQTTSRLEKVADWIQRLGAWLEMGNLLIPEKGNPTDQFPLIAAQGKSYLYNSIL